MIAEQSGNEPANANTIERWSAYLEEVHSRIAHRFFRPEVTERAYRYIGGLLEDVGRKNSWQMAHSKVPTITFEFGGTSVAFADFRLLKTPFPYITMMPQTDFLEFITGEAARYSNFRLLMGASVRDLIEEHGQIRGVRYRSRDGLHEVRALLTLGADGRFSRVRRLAGFEPTKTSPPMDVLWFRLPRRKEESEVAIARFSGGQIGILLARGEQ